MFSGLYSTAQSLSPEGVSEGGAGDFPRPDRTAPDPRNFPVPRSPGAHRSVSGRYCPQYFPVAVFPGGLSFWKNPMQLRRNVRRVVRQPGLTRKQTAEDVQIPSVDAFLCTGPCRQHVCTSPPPILRPAFTPSAPSCHPQGNPLRAAPMHQQGCAQGCAQGHRYPNIPLQKHRPSVHSYGFTRGVFHASRHRN